MPSLAGNSVRPWPRLQLGVAVARNHFRSETPSSLRLPRNQLLNIQPRSGPPGPDILTAYAVSSCEKNNGTLIASRDLCRILTRVLASTQANLVCAGDFPVFHGTPCRETDTGFVMFCHPVNHTQLPTDPAPAEA